MRPRDGDVRTSYEDALRSIGRHLDCEPAYHIAIVEVTDGFAVRWHPTLHQTNALVDSFAWAKLTDLAVLNSAGRNMRRRAQRHQGMWLSFSCGHEDALRALGFRLDAAEARGFSLDEVPEGLAVSYLRRQAESSRVEKVYRLYEREDVENLYGEAQARRRVLRQAAV